MLAKLIYECQGTGYLTRVIPWAGIPPKNFTFKLTPGCNLVVVSCSEYDLRQSVLEIWVDFEQPAGVIIESGREAALAAVGFGNVAVP